MNVNTIVERSLSRSACYCGLFNSYYSYKSDEFSCSARNTFQELCSSFPAVGALFVWSLKFQTQERRVVGCETCGGLQAWAMKSRCIQPPTTTHHLLFISIQLPHMQCCIASPAQKLCSMSGAFAYLPPYLILLTLIVGGPTQRT